MPKSSDPVPSFNLWTEPWITLERPNGDTERLGIEQTLLRAREFRCIYEPSPLVVAGIHRLLVAVLQAALDPQKKADLKRLWAAGQFPAKAVREFGKQYADRFDLFSENAPFLQSADLPLQPGKGDDIKSVSLLTVDTSRSTTIEHYRHGRSKDEFFCAACTASGLVTIPPFTSSGGRGLKPSINGVPPIYILPGGQSLFESLAASLVTPDYQPEVASKKNDAAWWTRRPRVEHSKEVREVGYLYSLTFPARRVRLHPEPLNVTCTRCGRTGEWGVRTMVFEMGESRPKDASFWHDPFAAYKLPEGKVKDKPTPIRPTPGKAVWREFAGLFLPGQGQEKHTLRPRVLDQIAELGVAADTPTWPFRCVGLRTDMKAKVFEWIDVGFDVPLSMLGDEIAGLVVDEAIQFATDCVGVITGTFRDKRVFGSSSKKSARNKGLTSRMSDEYWAALAGSFRQFVLDVAVPDGREAARRQWANTVTRQAKIIFANFADAMGDDADSLRRSETGKKLCNIRLAEKRKEHLNE
jgi:CRISPR system Cascade subunit CasA